MNTFLNDYDIIFILMAIVSIGIGIGFGKFARMRLNPSIGSPTIWYEKPPIYFTLLIIEEGTYLKLFGLVSILSAYVLNWKYIFGFIIIYILSAIFCGLFEGLYQRLTSQRFYEKWTLFKILCLPLDFMVIKYAIEKLPKEIEIFGFSMTTIILLIVIAIIFPLVVILAGTVGLVPGRK